MGEEVEHDWDLPLTIDSVCHISNTGVILMGVEQKFSVNDKGECYKKSHITHE